MTHIRRLLRNLESIHTISKRIIIVGSLLSLLVLLCGYGSFSALSSRGSALYSDFLLCTETVKTSVMLFTESLIGAILFDYLALRRQ